MNRDQMWRPEASYGKKQESSCSAEEGGRGSMLQEPAEATSVQEEDSSTPTTTTAPTAFAARNKKKAIIPRRRTPTVCIPNELKPSGSTNSSEEGSTPTSKGYATIEKKEQPLLVLLEFSSKVYEPTKIENPKTHNWHCGWTDHELQDLHYTPKPTTTGSDVDRSRLQTPADGYRSTLHSRASSSRYTSARGGRKTYTYTFHHFDDLDSHIETYRELYSYTSLNSDPSQRKPDEDKLFFDGEDVEQDAEIMFPIDMKSMHHGDLHLKELMNRLGIKVPLTPEQERQQQLLQVPRPTPPSIVKKRRNEKDSVSIVVSNSAPKRQVASGTSIICTVKPV